MTIVLDTNIFVAAGFNEESHSAQIIEGVREGRIDFVWDEPTRAESRAVIRKIPPLSWERFTDLFRDADRYEGETNPGKYTQIGDPDDRKFAALAYAADAVLISNDDDLLGVREALDVTVLTPGEWVRQRG